MIEGIAGMIAYEINFKILENAQSITNTFIKQHQLMQSIQHRQKTAQDEFEYLKKASEK